MNGPLKMYPMRQIVRHDLNVELPSCMYKLKNIHAATNDTGPSADHVSSTKKSLDISEQVKQFLKNNQEIPGMAALEIRQEEILRQLATLKQQMLTLRADLNVQSDALTSKAVPQTVPFICGTQVPQLPDVIVNVSPLHPPYSLLMLQKLWSNSLQLNVKTHIHSSVSSLPASAAKVSEMLESFQAQNVPKLNLRLIWKDVGANAQLMATQIPIVGEVNILRYLARLGQNKLNYELLPNQYEIDAVLDTCYCIVSARTKTERASLLQSINKKLGKTQWLCGRNEITIADLAACSAIKQVAQNEITQNLTKWLQRCEQVMF